VENLAVEAVDAMNLDFGAVDIIMDTDNNVFVLEVNSAPGLGNTETLEVYAKAIEDYQGAH
jgi:glutathione synthase/RimK-type ligase-like ATP-grasp enzyme